MKSLKNIWALFCMGAFVVILFFGCGKETSIPPTEPSINQNPAFALQGFNICAWDKNWWSDDSLVDEGLRFAIEEGSTCVVLDWPVNFNDDGTMVPIDNSMHPFWDDIRALIAKAKAKGLFVMLKPHTTLSNSAENRNRWNTDINSFIPSSFFSAYKTYLVQLAGFAAQNNVDAMCIGTEMNHLDWLFRDEWLDLIAAVRAQFSGPLTYDALFNRWFKDEKDINEVIFWDQLDFIGVSLYVPVTTDDNASIETIKQGWFTDFCSWFEIDNVIAYLKDIANRNNKQIMAVEGGYQSVNLGLYNVNDPPSIDKRAYDDLQSRGLDAYLSVLDENKENWFKGVSLWDITPHMLSPAALSSIYHTQSFSVYRKPAAEVVKKHYIKP